MLDSNSSTPSRNASKAWLVAHMTTNGFFAFAPQTFASSKRMTSSPTCVFPAPGGPWITATLLVSALFTAAACDLSKEPQPSMGQASSSKIRRFSVPNTYSSWGNT